MYGLQRIPPLEDYQEILMDYGLNQIAWEDRTPDIFLWDYPMHLIVM